jgi:hypothetical protein
MPFPLTFLVEKNLLPDLPKLNPGSLTFILLTVFLHYAVKRRQNPSPETILQLFHHVTKETLVDRFGLNFLGG